MKRIPTRPPCSPVPTTVSPRGSQDSQGSSYHMASAPNSEWGQGEDSVLSPS